MLVRWRFGGFAWCPAITRFGKVLKEKESELGMRPAARGGLCWLAGWLAVAASFLLLLAAGGVA